MNQTLNTVPDCLKIGEWEFHVRSHELIRNGKTIRLEPRVAALLLYLATHPGEPASRTALLEALWPGVVVSDEALTNAVNKLRRAFEDDRANPKVIETIPKAGYRLLLPVQALEPVPRPFNPAPVSVPVSRDGKTTRRWQITLTVLAVVALVVLIITSLQLSGPAPPNREPATQASGITALRPSLAVLPFENLGAEPDQEYFADGVTDDLIRRLAQNPGLMVIARDSTFYYKGKTLDPRTIATKLNTGYVLRGSVRHEGETLKLNVSLVDGATGTQIWTQQYESKVAQVFETLGELSRGITTALAVTPTSQDTGAGTANPLAYDALLLGKYHFYRFENRAENLKARTYFEEAVQLDPKFATAHAMLAWTYVFAAMNGWSDDRPAALAQAERIATHALELQPVLPLAYFVRGLSYREQHEYIMALVEAQRAIDDDPSYANAYVLLATLLYYAGRPEEGLQRIQQAMQINPHHPYNYHFHLGQAYFVLHRYQEAIEALNHGLSSFPASERMRVWLAAALAQSGDVEEANWQGQQIMAADPDFSIQRMTQTFPFNNPADLEHFTGGLRLAGLK